eukprot:2013848-Prymnesium_polylepis.1
MRSQRQFSPWAKRLCQPCWATPALESWVFGLFPRTLGTSELGRRSNLDETTVLWGSAAHFVVRVWLIVFL